MTEFEDPITTQEVPSGLLTHESLSACAHKWGCSLQLIRVHPCGTEGLLRLQRPKTFRYGQSTSSYHTTDLKIHQLLSSPSNSKYTNLNYTIRKILASTPAGIANLFITLAQKQSLYELPINTIGYLKTSNKDDHPYLGKESESNHFIPGMQIDEYVNEHKQSSSNVLAAGCPNISKPKASLNTMIAGLNSNPETTFVGLPLLFNPLNDITAFQHQFKRVTAYSEPQ